MSAPEACLTFTALIVCTDVRAETLARRLADKFTVHAIRGQASWLWDKETNGFAERREYPRTPDALFFHTGRGDDKLIPSDCKAKHEFAFSGDVEPGTSRPKAYRILAPFTEAQCPVAERFVRELTEMLEGKRSDPPAVCIRRRGALLAALAILAQGYLTVSAAASDELVDAKDRATVKTALDEMGWTKLLNGQTVDDRFGRDLSPQRKQVKDPNWWRQPFKSEEQPGSPSRFDWQEFKDDVRHEWRMAGDEDEMAWEAVSALLLTLQSPPPPEAPVLSPVIVASAYLEIAARLKGGRR